MVAKEMSNKVRLLHFDFLKGVAIWLVVLGHVWGHASGPMYTRTILLPLLDSIHMPLFMMLSGYFLNRPLDLSKRGVAHFWKSKAIRLLLPLLFAPLCYDWIRNGVSLELPHKAIFQEYWFTSTLFAFMVLLYIFRVWAQIKEFSSLSIGVGVTLWAIFVSYMASLLLNIDLPEFMQLFLYKTAWCFPYFILGFLVGRFDVLERSIRDERLGALAFFVYVGLLWYYSVNIFSLEPSHLLIIARLLTISGLISFYSLASSAFSKTVRAEDCSYLSRILICLGRESLPIYLTHYFFIPALPWLKAFLDSFAYRPQVFAWEFALGALGTIMVLVPTLLLVRIIKSNKYLALLLYGEELPAREHK